VCFCGKCTKVVGKIGDFNQIVKGE
jgi:hypothetical protein